ncbi:MAG: transcription termination/antitermination protein NusG [Rickettsiales bacterium]|jgi:transcriptional antiterminator NusG|nr:transcription termination/antitermination protein NusG [Rickettsiales bacterium]
MLDVKTQNDKNESARWYVVYVHSGCENAVVQRLTERVKRAGMEKMFEEMLIPSQETYELKAGKKVKVEKKVFPGYLLLRMVMNNETWHLVKDISLVTGFLGSKTSPTPISEKEAETLIHRLEDKNTPIESAIAYEVGEQIKVVDGPFASFNGVVEKVDQEKQRVSVSVSIFGRPTQVDLGYSQIEKV